MNRNELMNLAFLTKSKLFKTTIINRTIGMDMLSAIAEGAALFTFVFLMKRLYDLTDLIVTGGTSLIITMQMLFSILPSIMILTFPMAALLAALMVYGRMANENEITALFAGRYSPIQLLAPAILIGVILTMLLFWWGNRIAPKGLRNFQDIAADVLRDTATGGIRPGGFNQLGDFTIVPGELKSGKIMTTVRLFERKDDEIVGVISSATGTLAYVREDNSLSLDLYHGQLYQMSSIEKDVVINFGEMNFEITIPKLLSELAKAGKDVQRFSNRELRRKIQTIEKNIPPEKRTAWDTKWYIRYKVELAKRYSLPFACLIMPIIGALLGMNSRYGKRSASYGTTIGVIFTYYMLLSFGVTFAKNETLPTLLSIWIPNLVSMVLMVFLYYRTLRT